MSPVNVGGFLVLTNELTPNKWSYTCLKFSHFQLLDQFDFVKESVVDKKPNVFSVKSKTRSLTLPGGFANLL
jgi:hypothetical protein